MPFGPPTRGGIGFVAVVGVALEEVDVIDAGFGWVTTDVVGVVGAVEVDLDEVPLRSE